MDSGEDQSLLATNVEIRHNSTHITNNRFENFPKDPDWKVAVTRKEALPSIKGTIDDQIKELTLTIITNYQNTNRKRRASDFCGTRGSKQKKKSAG